MRIDAHQHFWQLERGYYDWLTPDLSAIYRDFLPSDLSPILQSNNVEGTILVQAAPCEAETYFLFELAKSDPSVLGVVGWVDMESPDAVERLKEMAEESGGLLKGIRPMIQDIPDADWILSDCLAPVFEELQRADLVFDALILPIHLNNLDALLDAYPRLKIIIDHGAKPPIADRCRSKWAADLERVARHQNVFCKLSGLVTEAGHDWVEADIRPYIGEIIRCFTPNRVVWGSDWPVVNLASDYSSWLEIVERYCARFTPSEQAAIMGENALNFYGVKMSCSTL